MYYWFYGISFIWTQIKKITRIHLLIFLVTVSLIIVIAPICMINLLEKDTDIYQIGVRTFGTKESMWVAIAAFLAAINIMGFLLWPVLERKEQEEDIKDLIKKGLKSEIKTNFRLIFTPEIERKTEWVMFNKLRDNLNMVPNISRFEELALLYKENEYYEDIVKLFRFKSTKLINEKHTILIKKYLDFIAQHINKGIKNDLINLQERIDAEKTQLDLDFEVLNKLMPVQKFSDGNINYPPGRLEREQELFEMYRTNLIKIFHSVDKPIFDIIDQYVESIFMDI